MEETKMKFEITPATAFLLGLLACLTGVALNYAMLVNIPLGSLSVLPGMKVTAGGVEYHHLLYNLIILTASLFMIYQQNKTVKLLGFFFLGVSAALFLDDFILSKQVAGLILCLG
jgi:hypothetical protein